MPLTRAGLRIPIVCLLSLAALVAMACSGADESPQAAPTATEAATAVATADSSAYGPADESPVERTNGVLRMAQARDPTSCDLPMSQATSYQSVHPCNPLLSQIVKGSAQDHSVIVPDLAISWETSDDGTEWTFTVRPDIKWHNGRALTSDDLKFSLDRIIDPPAGMTIGRGGVIARYVGSVSQLTAPDQSTLAITLDFPAASFLPNLSSVYVSVYPRAETELLDPPSMAQFSSVVGTGPFTAGSVTRGSAYSLLKNTGYYEPGLPKLNEVRFLVIPEPAVRMAALRTHEIDAIAIITEPEAQVLERDFAGEINVFRSPSAGGNTVQLNLNEPPFDDPRVRRAVNLALSRPDADLALGPGYAGAILPPGGPWGLDQSEVMTLAGYGDKEVERAEARALLEQAGYPDGLEAPMLTQANPFFQTLADFAAGQLSLVGIKSEVTPVEPVDYQRIIRTGEFKIIGHSHSFSLDDPDPILTDHYSCGGSENFPGLCDPELDRMIEQQSRLLDSGERKALLDDIQRKIWQENAKIWFQWSSRRAPVWANVHGLEPGGPSLYQGRRLARVWIE